MVIDLNIMRNVWLLFIGKLLWRNYQTLYLQKGVQYVYVSDSVSNFGNNIIVSIFRNVILKGHFFVLI